MRTHFLKMLALVGLLQACGQEAGTGFRFGDRDEFTERQALSLDLQSLKAQREVDSAGSAVAEGEYHIVMKEESPQFEDLLPPDDKPAPSPEPRQAPRPKVPGQQTRFAPPDTAQPKLAAQIMKTAELEYRVADFAKATKAINAVVAKHQGYVAHTNQRNAGYRMEGQVELRVPHARFDTLLTDLLQLADYVDNNNVKAQDVTEEYVDLVSRIRAKQAVENRYLELIKQARNVTEVLEVEDKLRQLREEKEVSLGRLKYLQDRVRFSTIALTYYQPNANYQAEAPTGFFTRLGQGLRGGWDGLLGLAVGLAYLWPLLLLGGLGAWWLRKRWQAYRAKPKPTPPAS
jgi:Domain of unknown function (DUF4349)